METAVKTAISMPKALFARVNELAREMNVSRSRLIVLALHEFIGRRDQERYRASIDAAYGDGPDAEERVWLDVAPLLIRESHAEDEW